MQTVILNDYKGPSAPLINTMILVTKQYIYAACCMNEKIKFTMLLGKVKDIYQVEKELAIQGNRLPTHSKKWAAISHIYEQ